MLSLKVKKDRRSDGKPFNGIERAYSNCPQEGETILMLIMKPCLEYQKKFWKKSRKKSRKKFSKKLRKKSREVTETKRYNK